MVKVLRAHAGGLWSCSLLSTWLTFTTFYLRTNACLFTTHSQRHSLKQFWPLANIWPTMPTLPTTTILLLLIVFVYPYVCAHPAARAGATCHGPIGGIRYRYHYHTSLTLNNQDNFEPAGFELDARFAVQNLWQNKQSYLLLIESESLQFKPRANVRSFQFTAGPTLTDWPQVLAQVDGQTGKAMSLYVPKSTSQHHLEPTQMNLIVSLIGSLRNRFDSNEKVRVYLKLLSV